MKERPILFSAPMVRALLDGTKTQTRRVVKISHRTPGLAACLEPSVGAPRPRVAAELCPYGQPGDRLWVRETFSALESFDFFNPAVPEDVPSHWYWADGDPEWGDWTRPKPSIHMPRWASRILLEITGVRVERLQEITEGDIIAEGCPREILYGTGWYRDLWERIHGAGSWAANPWVWCVEFRRIKP